ncbi:SNF2 family N-terminal domain-containing protein [Lipomyces arxii]|uniref:SNF2 family N-terminal domain-containing protein n=1 Tax=Lipomyces arxii TaxID=56418 RepID=UPI0034CF162E
MVGSTPPPAKRRRFFLEEDAFKKQVETVEQASAETQISTVDETQQQTVHSSEDIDENESEGMSLHETPASSPPPPANVESKETTESSTLNKGLIESITGRTLSAQAFIALQDMCSGDMTRAVNYILDGTFDSHIGISTKVESKSKSKSRNVTPEIDEEPVKTKQNYDWTERYIGSLQIEGWATRSGRNLLAYGEEIFLKRVARQVNLKSRFNVSTAKAKENDIFVRFTNTRGQEIGRLPTDKARFVSTLLDLKICSFKGNCIYADDVINTGDNIYIQLDCFLSRDAFNPDPSDLNTSSSVNSNGFLLKVKETDGERHLRLRQMALIKLFADIGLKPFNTNDLLTHHQAKGQLEAAAMAEQFDIKIGQNSDSEDTDGADEGTNLKQDQLDALYKKAQTYDSWMPEVEAADSFKMELRPYQKQGLGWMISKETLESKKDDKQIDSMHPLWEEYRWPVRENETALEEPNDRFYLNPYSGEVSFEFPRFQQNSLGGVLADEMGLGKTISTMSLIHSSKYDPEVAGRQMSEQELHKFAATTTLIVAPMSLLTQWESEAKSASKPGTVNVVLYYGDRSIDLFSLCCTNRDSRATIIITSYGTVASEWQRHTKSQGDKLFRLHFLRVVLDEAHLIRNRSSLTSKSCCALSADRRWALTGTPIVNRLEDLYSLVKFLNIEPWSHFAFWRTFITVPYESKDFLKALDVVQTVLEPIVLRRTKSMKQQDGTPLIVLPPKNIYIEDIQLTGTEREVYDLFYRRAKQTFTASVEAGTVMKSYTTIFAQILRLRQSCDHPLLVQSAVEKDEFEMDVSEDAEDRRSTTGDKAENGLLENTDDVSLKQLIDKFTASEEEFDARDHYGYEVMQQILKATENECPICSTEPIVEQVVTPCWHMSCKNCLLEHIKFQQDHGQVPRCHSCRAEISEKDIFEVVYHPSADSNKSDIALRRYKPQSSAKISRLMSRLRAIRLDEPTAKSVVFSQFTTFLDCIQDALQRDRFSYFRIDGATPQKERARVLDRFQQDPGEMILLLSLKTGGVGLNLVSATKVFMMDPWWSYAVEEQAIDRIHRMGQTQSVSVYRFIVKGSVEERMLKIQDRKKFLALSLGMSEDQKKSQRIEDIKLLFD